MRKICVKEDQEENKKRKSWSRERVSELSVEKIYDALRDPHENDVNHRAINN